MNDTELNDKENYDADSNSSDTGLNGSEPSVDSSNDQKEPQKPKSKTRNIIIELLIYAVLLFVCIYIVPKYVVQRTIVDGESMENTLFDGENLIINKLAYHFGDPDRFDIVVFYPYGRNMPEEYYVKRIIGLPGEKVEIIGENIYINDKLLEENYGKDPITDPGIAENPIILGEDEFFVLGDNREVSEDSRSFGPVKKSNLSGHVVLRIYPFDSFGTVD